MTTYCSPKFPLSAFAGPMRRPPWRHCASSWARIYPTTSSRPCSRPTQTPRHFEVVEGGKWCI